MTNTFVKISDDHIAIIHEHIAEELGKRCINVPFKLYQSEEKRTLGKLMIESEPFYSVPNLHGELTLYMWAGTPAEAIHKYISEEGGQEVIKAVNTIKVWCSIYVAYQGNCTELFSFCAEWSPEQSYPSAEFSTKEISRRKSRLLI